MKFENIAVYNFHGMRNPMNSWDKSDSDWVNGIIGEKDLELAQKLIKAGSEHRKFMRQIFVSVDITAPIYLWKELDTYKVATTANSTSTMHKLASTPIALECFDTDDYNIVMMDLSGKEEFINVIEEIYIPYLERLRQLYNDSKDIRYWKELIRWLPQGWSQTRTWTCSYETLYVIYHQRKNHKLTEWSNSFMAFIDSLPYANELIKI